MHIVSVIFINVFTILALNLSHISHTKRICNFKKIYFFIAYSKITLHSCNRPSHISNTEHINFVNNDIILQQFFLTVS